MCTRFYIEAETDEIREILEAVQRSALTKKFVRDGNAVLSSGEIRPANVVPVIAPGKNGVRAVFPMKWGFQIPGRALLPNARTETAAQKPTFKASWEQHRCVIPASWYYEWEHFEDASGRKKSGERFAIQPRNSKAVWLAGLYRIEEGTPVFTVLTRAATEELEKLHDRMPLMLPGRLVDAWISPFSSPEKLLQYAVTDVVSVRDT